ncbi:hypothetical protein [Paracraurococcus ruber]|uniref:Uncharacterized protein n=1 Tax=Paracraurococcus ruber TaxID=77675 RepID=A0ABS1D898_9PROT|nr:hypothetical protein [Paracraurococcus ruber]MBK1662821.1 hypothetical protein [Paracraurococcus ruber]
MSGVALLGTLLREALPDAAVLDLTGHGGRVFAWCPGAWPGIADAAALPAAERALLGRFRQGPARHPPPWRGRRTARCCWRWTGRRRRRRSPCCPRRRCCWNPARRSAARPCRAAAAPG